ncbi:MAG: hypothetical protein K0Q83_3730 [Deltaproteobacteria bacterium]|jgi:hypothetical protein|nr:hypothetical protein [Deltaproteobacteria bacterium]
MFKVQQVNDGTKKEVVQMVKRSTPEITRSSCSSSLPESLEGLNPPASVGWLGLGTGLYSYSFDSQTAPFRGFTLTVVGRNE